MPLIKSSSDAARSKNIAEMIGSDHPRNQAIAAAYSNQKKYEKKKPTRKPILSK